MIQVIMFTGPNCAACKVMKPLAEANPKIDIVDVSEDPVMASRYGIRGGLPVFIKLVNGEFDDILSGAQSEKTLNAFSGVIG